jgi:hypothetical protein
MAAVYWNQTAREFLVQAMWRKPHGGSSNQGDPVRIPEDRYDVEITAAVLKALDGYDNSYDPDKAPRRSDAEYERFIRSHISVVVEQDGERLKLFPMTLRARGYAGIGSKTILKRRDAAAELPILLRQSFAAALEL